MAENTSLLIAPNTCSPATKSRQSMYKKIEDKEKEGLQKGDLDKAEKFVECQMVREFNGQEYQKYDLFKTTTKQLGKQGIGIQLYFNLLKRTSVIFLLMSIVAIPSLVSNCIGYQLRSNEVKNKLDYTTLGNQPAPPIFIPSNKTQWSLDVFYNNQTLQKEMNDTNSKLLATYITKQNNNLLMVGLPDLFYTIIFLVFVMLIRLESRKIIKENKSQNIYVQDYGLLVKNFPSTIINEDEIFDHFSQFGKIVECKLARNYFGTLLQYKILSQLENLLIIEQKKQQLDPSYSLYRFEKLLKKKEKTIEKINKEKKNYLKGLESHLQYPSLHAYVLFEDYQVRNKVLKEYQKIWRWDLKRIFFGFCQRMESKMPKKYQFQGKYPLKVMVPPAPSDILWENLDAGYLEKLIRKIFSIILVIILMLITFGFILAVSSVSTSTNSSECPSNVVNMYNQDNDILKDNLKMIECYCSEVGATYQNVNSQSICYNWAKNQLTLEILNIIASFIIVIINFCLKILLKYLGSFERYSTLTGQTFQTIIKIFTSMFINTAILTLILNGNIFGFISSYIITAIIPPLQTIVKSNSDNFPSDFNSQWYLNVGSKILVTWIVNLVSPHLVFVFTTPIYTYLRKKTAQKQILQKDMNKELTPLKYDLTSKYALALNTIFVTLFYSSGMPVLLILGSISLFFQYWAEKYLLLRYNSKPVLYDEKLNENIVKILPLSIAMHLAIGIYMYGCQNFFPQIGNLKWILSSQETFQSRNLMSPKWIVVNDTYIWGRIYNVLYLFVALVIIGGFLIFDISVYTLLKKCLKKTQVQPDNKEKKRKFGNYYEELKLLKINGIPSYEIQLNQQYKPLLDAINSTSPSKMKELKESAYKKSLARESGNQLKINVTDQQQNSQNGLNDFSQNLHQEQSQNHSQDYNQYQLDENK